MKGLDKMMHEPFARRAPLNLFNVSTWTAAGTQRAAARDKARTATPVEVVTYARWLAARDALPVLESIEVNSQGATFGVCLKRERFENGVWAAAEYEPGAYSIPLPGRRRGGDRVTMETLDEGGEVVSSSTLPIDPKKGGVIWDAAAVRRAVGPIDKPPRKRTPIEATAPKLDPRDALRMTAAEMAAYCASCRPETPAAIEREAVDAPPVAPLPIEPVEPQMVPAADEPAGTSRPEHLNLAPLYDRIAQLEAIVATLAPAPTDATPYRENDEPAATRPPYRGNVPGMGSLARMAIAGDADRARRLRIVRRYLAMRRQRAAAVREIAELKARPLHLGNEIRPDDLARAVRERDDARDQVAQLTERVELLKSSTSTVADQLDVLATRALRAENALRAAEARNARGGAPYIMPRVAVRFAASIAA
jgi:hypothetical protein